MLQLDEKPLAIDSTCYESRHVSRHFERRRRDSTSAEAVNAGYLNPLTAQEILDEEHTCSRCEVDC